MQNIQTEFNSNFNKKMSSSNCESKNHHKHIGQLVPCLFVDVTPMIYKTYCTSCFDRKQLNLEFEYQCHLCDRYLNDPCFFIDDHNYCYDCLDLHPDGEWNIPDADKDEMFDIIKEDKKCVKNNKLAELTNNSTYELLWLKSAIKEKIEIYRQKRCKQEIKDKNDEYTKIQRVSDSMKRFLPDIDDLDAYYSAKRIDMKEYDVDDVRFNDVSEFVDFLINIKPIYK